LGCCHRRALAGKAKVVRPQDLKVFGAGGDEEAWRKAWGLEITTAVAELPPETLLILQ
jgi:hypothetical protein